MTAVESTTAQVTACYDCWRPTPACLCEETRRPDWRERAACHSRHQPPHEAFTPTGWKGVLNREAAQVALRWCNGDPATGAPACPVRAVCLAWAHRQGDDWSVLGGTTPAQRRAQRAHARDMHPAPAAPSTPPRARRASLPPLTRRLADVIVLLNLTGMGRGAIAERLDIPYRYVVAVLGPSRSGSRTGVA